MDHFTFQKLLLDSFPKWDSIEKRTQVIAFTGDTLEFIQLNDLGDKFITYLKETLPANASLFRPYNEPIKQMYGENGYARDAFYIRFASPNWEITEPGSHDEKINFVDNWQL